MRSDSPPDAVTAAQSRPPLPDVSKALPLPIAGCVSSAPPGGVRYSAPAADEGEPALYSPLPRRGGGREYQRVWIAERRAAYFAGKSCLWCGSPDRLEIDHIDPAAKEDHRIWSWARPRREAELAKCRVLCRGCHIRRHQEEKRKPLVHGTVNAYRKRGCRCDLCRMANAERMRTWRGSKAVAK